MGPCYPGFIVQNPPRSMGLQTAIGLLHKGILIDWSKAVGLQQKRMSAG